MDLQENMAFFYEHTPYSSHMALRTSFLLVMAYRQMHNAGTMETDVMFVSSFGQIG